jgi:hypothetical protein
MGFSPGLDGCWLAEILPLRDAPGRWTPHAEIARQVYERTLGVFE